MGVKAYELVPLIANVVIPSEKSLSKIGCIECSGKYLFVGTCENFILKYVVEENTKTSYENALTCRRDCHKLIDIRKPIRLLKAASVVGKLIALCDTVLTTISIDTLELVGSGFRLKNVETFCVNENPDMNDPFCMQICVASVSKSQVAVYNVTIEDKFIPLTTVNLEEPVTCLSADSGFICAGLRSKYVICNFETNHVQDLFPFSNSGFLPYVCRVDKNEFLLNGPDGLGVFATPGGMSSHPPLKWSYPLISMAFHHPYVIGISHEIIMVHSVVDQLQKQAISFIGGVNIGNYEGRLYICSLSAVHALIPIPWEKQVDMLLADARVDEALSLIEKVGHPNYSLDQTSQLKKRFKQQAAFICFSRADMEQALDLFLESEVDEREVIAIFPGLMPKASRFVRTIPPLNNIADIIQLFHGDATKILQAKQLLTNFLQVAHDFKKSLHLLEINTALIKLYAELQHHRELESLLEAEELVCDFRDCSIWLERYKLFHAKALLHLVEGRVEDALSLWSRMLSGDIVDESFKGVEYFVEILRRINHLDLLWQYADIVLDYDERVGVRLFLLHPSTKDQSPSSVVWDIDPNNIVDFLQRYPTALILYLEYLILEKKNTDEKFHTQLAIQYLKRIAESQQSENMPCFTQFRDKLKNLLLESDHYRAQFLLPKVRDVGLDQEVAILYGKIGEHEKALKIFVSQLKDFDGAEDYCVRNGNSEGNADNELLHVLLATYLDPKLSDTERDDYLAPALKLLNKHAHLLDAVRVLEMVPAHWSLSILESFLHIALRSSINKFRLSKLDNALAKGTSFQQTCSLYSLQRRSIKLVETNYCCVCKKPFTDLNFAWYPNDVVTHVECGRLSNVCPLTGRHFTTMNALKPSR